MHKKEEIQNELNELSPELAKNSFSETYTAPEGFFEALPLSILKKISTEENKHVPEGYFDSLPAKIISSLHQAKIVAIKRKYYYIRMAVAAVITGLLGFVILIALQNKKSDNSPSLVKNSTVSQSYATLNSNNIEAEIDNLNEADIINYLEENGHDVNAALVASMENENLTAETDKLNVNDEKRIFEVLKNVK